MIAGPPIRRSAEQLPARALMLLLSVLTVAIFCLAPGSAGARSERTGPALFMVQVDGLPSAYSAIRALDRGAAERRAARQARLQADRNAALQQQVAEVIARRDLAEDELFRVATAFNGIAVLTAPGDLDRIRAIDGVRSVKRLPLARPANAFSVPYIGAVDLWGDPVPGGLAGAGMRIGVIDTGLDYVHTDFGGSGSALDLAAARTAANNPARNNLDPGTFTVNRASQQLYPSAKVAGGFDFAGDAYDADSPASAAPRPDPNPMDCPIAEGGGHGTHVAGSAAGYGVNPDGSTFAGNYSGLDPSGMRVGPGVAPEAEIFALRVFGCDGSSGLIVQALDWALDPNRDGDPSDRLDVLNLSLGSDFGLPDSPDALAATAASRAGTVVVAASGNGGNQIYQAGSPASSPQTITVANMISSRLLDGFRITEAATPANNGERPGSASLDFPWSSLATPVTGRIVYPASNRTGCAAFGPAASAAIDGKVVLLDWRSVRDDPASPFPCGSKARVDNAQAAGAIGVVLADSATSSTIAIAGNAAIPSIYVTSPLHDVLRDEAQAGSAKVTFSRDYLGSFRSDDEQGTVADSSSRGPGADGVLKPDVAAPGTEITSAAAGSGDRAIAYSGTSMASPHVAGLMALLRQAHPDWSVEEQKALVMNTALANLYSGPNQTGVPQPPQRVGTGTVDGPAALAAGTVAYATAGDGAVGVSFGPLEVPPGAPFSREASITVVNKNNLAKSGLAAEFLPRSSVPGASWSFPDGNSIDLPANGSAQLTVRLSVPDPSALRNQKEATLLSGSNREWIAETSGLVRLTEPGGRTTSVPVYASLAPVSTLAADTGSVSLPEGASGGSLQIEGQAVDTGSSTSDFISLLTPLELQESSPRITPGPGDPPSFAAADLRDVGVAYDPDTDTVTFGISSWATQPNPSDFAWHDVSIDVDDDGNPDYAVFTDRDPDLDGADSFKTVVRSLQTETSTFTLPTPVTSFDQSGRTFDSDVTTMTVPRSSIGLSPVDSRFTYEVDGTRADTGTVIDSTEKLSFDYLNPGIRFPGSSIRPDVPGSLSFEYDDAAMRANGSTGALLIHHMNASGSRSEVVAISAERPFDLAVAGPSRVTEGRRITFAADVTNGFSDPLSFSWDLGDGDGFSTPGSSVAITPADGPSSIRLKLRATGASTPVLANRDLNVVNVAPRARVRNFGSRPRRLLLSATDPSRADTRAGFRYSVDFGADGSVERRPRGRSVRLAWPAGRRASVVRVTATDKDGASSRPVRLRRPALRVCRVPRLRGLAISRARARLGRANCRLGRVRRSAGRATGRFLVVSQSLRPGTVRAAGTRVAVTLRRR